MCPMDGKCNNQNMIYQAEVTTPTSRETYIGLCDTTFKLRYRNHVCSFKNERYKHATELSKYIWSLKDKSIYIYIYIYMLNCLPGASHNKVNIQPRCQRGWVAEWLRHPTSNLETWVQFPAETHFHSCNQLSRFLSSIYY